MCRRLECCLSLCLSVCPFCVLFCVSFFLPGVEGTAKAVYICLPPITSTFTFFVSYFSLLLSGLIFLKMGWGGGGQERGEGGGGHTIARAQGENQ